jgi:hypothetical protein
MFHFFSTCNIIKTAIKNYFEHKIKKIKIITKLKTFDHDVLDPNFRKIDRFFLRRPNLLRYLIKISILFKIKNITRAQKLIGDFYIEVHNSNGINKKLIKNTSLKDILLSANNLNCSNKTDGMYNDKLINEVNIYSNYLTCRYNIKNIIVNVDCESDLDLRELLLYNNINIYNFDRINFVITNFNTFDEEIIDTQIYDFLDKKVNELI